MTDDKDTPADKYQDRKRAESDAADEISNLGETTSEGFDRLSDNQEDIKDMNMAQVDAHEKAHEKLNRLLEITGEEDEEELEDEEKRISLATIGYSALGALGLGSGLVLGSAAYDRVTGEPQALRPQDYDLHISNEDSLGSLELTYANSDTEELNSVGDRLERESENEELALGFKSGWTYRFVDINTGDDLIKRYDFNQAIYDRAFDEAEDVTYE